MTAPIEFCTAMHSAALDAASTAHAATGDDFAEGQVIKVLGGNTLSVTIRRQPAAIQIALYPAYWEWNDTPVTRLEAEAHVAAHLATQKGEPA